MEDHIGIIKLFGGSFVPVGWEICDGHYLGVKENPDLFKVIGNKFGGDGVTTFAVPNLCGRVPVGTGKGEQLTEVQLGQTGGAEQVTLSPSQMPAQTISIQTSPGTNSDNKISILTPGNEVQPFYNVQPYLTINFIIYRGDALPTTE